MASANQTHTHTHIFSRLTWQHTHAHAHTHTHTHLSLRWDVAELCLELLFTMLLRNRDRISALWPRVYAHFQVCVFVCVSVLVCTHARKHQCAVAEGVCTLSGVCVSISLHSCPQASVRCGRGCMHTVRCVCVCVSVSVCTHARKHQCAVAESVCTLSGNVCVRLSFSLHSCPQASVCCGRKCMHTVRCVCLSFSLHSCPQASVR